MTFYHLPADDDEDEIRNHLKQLDSEANECAAELGVPKEVRYDMLAALHGEAFLGERDASPFEASSSFVFQSEDDKEIEKMLPSQDIDARDLEEAVWVHQVLQGDLDALEKLYESYVDIIYSYFLKRVRNETDAEALTSEVFTRAIETLLLGKYKWQSVPFRTWLFNLAHRILQEKERASRRQSSVSLEDLNDYQLRIETEADIREVLRVQERQDTLWQLVRELPLISQQILIMIYAEKLSFAEIAERLQRSKNACRLLHYLALIQLKHMVSEPDLRGIPKEK